MIKSGIVPSHIDSHHHVHTEWSIGSLVIKIAKKYNIHSIRLSRNTGVGITFEKKIYKYLYNTRLKLYGFRVTDYFDDYVDLMQKKLTSDVELMVHPLLKDDVLVDLDGTKLELVIEKILNDF